MGYHAFAFADKNGEATVFNIERDTTNIGSRDYFLAALNGQTVVSDLIVSRVTGELVLIFASPVYQHGEVVGVLYGRKDGNMLNEIIGGVNYKKTGYAYMINNQGITVAHKNNKLVLRRDNDIENMENDEALRDLGELTKKMATRLIGSGIYTYNGIEKIVGYAPIEDTPWIVVYGLEKTESFENAYALVRILWMFVLAIGAIGTVIVYTISTRISEPLIRICKEIETYEEDTTISLPVKYLKRDDEIGVLAKGIILMMERISGHILEMKEKNQELMHAKEVINLEKSLLETTLHSIGDGVISTDQNGNIQLLNDVAEDLTGWGNEEAHGLPFEIIFNIINEFSRNKCSCPVKKVLGSAKINKLDEGTVLISKNGDELPIEDSAAPILDSTGGIKGVVVVFRDCTDRNRVQAEILHLSYHDQLTGLYNRRFFEETLKRLNTKEHLPLSLVMFDVNGLKLTNDAFGHCKGDKLLQIVANTIKNVCRTDDIISRVGGDEFILLLPKTSYKDAETIIQRIYSTLEQTRLDDLVISVSTGWETKISPEEDIMRIYAKAEENMYRRKLIESQSMRSKTVQVIAKTLNERNERERIHSENVSKISRKIGIALHLNQEFLREIEMAGLLHDIGKIAVDNNVLNKSGKLTNAEYEIIKRHPEIGYHILKSADSYSNISDYVLAHHECWDGTGYPRGIKGEEIPLASRIIAIADAYEAMVSKQTYRKKMSREKALNELRVCAGTQFDPDIVRVFCENVRIEEED